MREFGITASLLSDTRRPPPACNSRLKIRMNLRQICDRNNLPRRLLKVVNVMASRM